MINDIVLAISNFMYTYLLIIILLAGGIYFTFRTPLHPVPDVPGVSAGGGGAA